MNTILLSFDTEEFDVPREHGVDFSLEEGMKVSREGTNRILDVLKANGVKATFFCTGNFAEHAPEVMQRIMDEGHEVACHGVDHWQPKETDFARSKEIVERVTGRQVYGYRQPRMFPVSDSEIARVGYTYNSSLNPAFIPGRYMHLTAPRTSSQPARRSLPLARQSHTEARRLFRHLFPPLGVLRSQGAPRVQDALHHQEPQRATDDAAIRPSYQDAERQRKHIHDVQRVC